MDFRPNPESIEPESALQCDAPVSLGVKPSLFSALIGVLRRSSAVALLFTVLGVAPAAFAASVAVDVGHYREKPGVTSARGVAEFEYNLRLARDIAAALRRAGHETLLIGDDGLAEDLRQRAARADGRDLLISVHHDSVQAGFLSFWDYEGALLRHSDRFSGFSLFVSRLNGRTDASLGCASAIGAALRGAGFAPSRYHADPIPGENRPFADEANGVHYFDHLAVLETASVPALLFEAGVIVNRDEELQMRDPAVRERIARSITTAVGACLK